MLVGLVTHMQVAPPLRLGLQKPFPGQPGLGFQVTPELPFGSVRNCWKCSVVEIIFVMEVLVSFS